MRSIWETVVACIILLNVVICGIGVDLLRRVAKTNNNSILLRCWNIFRRKFPNLGRAAVRFTDLWDRFTDASQLEFQDRLQIFCDGIGEFFEDALTGFGDWFENFLSLSAAEQDAALCGVPKKKLYPNDIQRGVGPLRVTCCSVCLDDFKKGEEVRILRGCRHVFHCKCTDLWLYRRQVCPVCRHGIKL